MRLERIEARDNRRLVHARKVRDGRTADAMFIEGRRLAHEALTSGLEVDECLAVDEMSSHPLVQTCLERGISTATMPEGLFRTIADTKSPQGIILIGRRPSGDLQQLEKRLSNADLPLIIYLNEVNDPSNLGAVARTAEAAGAAGIVLSQNSADPFSPKALRASMGSAFRLPFAEKVSMKSLREWSESRHMITTATSADADRAYTEIDWSRPRILVFGSEAHGLTEIRRDLIDEFIRIPMSPPVESLNLAVSAGIILFEARRQV